MGDGVMFYVYLNVAVTLILHLETGKTPAFLSMCRYVGKTSTEKILYFGVCARTGLNTPLCTI